MHEGALAALGAILLSWLLIAADREGFYGAGRIPYSNGGGCDAWFYFSLIISPQSGSVFGAGTRFISRPLHFAPVHLVKVLFPDLDPNMASFLFFLPLATCALYVGLRAEFGRATSFAATMLLGTAPLLINMASSTYVPIAAAAYANCMLACLLWTGRLAGKRLIAHLVMAFLAGTFFVFAANANMMAIKFDCLYVLLALPVQFLASGERSWRQAALWTARAAGGFVVGMAAGTVAALALSAIVGLGLLTPLRQIAEAISGIDQTRDGNWRHETVGFALIGLITVLGAFVFRLLDRRRGAPELRLALIAAVAVATGLLNLLLFVASGDMNLAYDWWYFLLLPCVALAFCSAFGEAIEADRKAALFVLAGTVIAANLVLSHVHSIKQLVFDDAQLLSYGIVGALAACLLLLRRWPRSACAIALTALSLQAAHSSIMHQHYFRSLDEVRGQVRATEQAFTFIAKHVGEKPVVWIADADNHGLDLSIFRSLIRCSFDKSFPGSLPDPKTHWQQALAPGRTLVLIDGNASPLSDIRAALARHGMALDVVASRYIWRIENVSPGVQLTIGKVQ